MAGKEISFKIAANDQATGTLHKLAGTLNSLSKSVQGKFAGFEKIKSAFVGFSLAVPGLQAVGKAFQVVSAGVKDCEQAFTKLEQTEKRIDFAARINTSLGMTSTALKQFVSDASELTGNLYAGGDIMAAISPIAFDKTSEQIKKITLASIDLSAAIGTDLNSATQKLNSTFAGEAGELAKLFPELKKLTKEQLEAGAAIDIVAEKVRGAAKAMNDSTYGSIERYKNSTGDLKEELGSLVSGFFNPMRDLLAGLAKGWADALAAKRAYKEATVAVDKGVANSDQYELLINKNTEKYEEDKRIFGNTWDRSLGTNYRVQNSGVSITPELAQYYTEKWKPDTYGGRDNISELSNVSGYTRNQLAEFFNGMDAAFAGRGGDRSKTLFESELAKLVAQEKELSEYKEKQKEAIEAEEESRKRAAEEAAKAAILQREAEEKKTRAELDLAEQLLKIKNDIASGKISEIEGNRLSSDLSDKNYTEANRILSDNTASKELKETARLFLAAYNSNWDYLKALDEKQKADKQAEEDKKKADEQADRLKKYAADLNKAILNGMTPAVKALREFQQDDLYRSLSTKNTARSLSPIEEQAYQSLIHQEELLKKQVREEARTNPVPGAFVDFMGGMEKFGELFGQIGQMISGSNPLFVFVGALLKAVASIESVQKILDFFGTILQGIMDVIGPVIDTMLKPFVGFLTMLGQMIGQLLIPVLAALEPVLTPLIDILLAALNILSPILALIAVFAGLLKPLVSILTPFLTIITLVAQALQWLAENVIYPVGKFFAGVIDSIANFFIDMINAVIDALNHIPFVNISKLGRSNLTGLLDEAFKPINNSDLTGQDTDGGKNQGTSSSVGSSYTAERDITVTVNIYADAIAGESGIRDLAIMIKNALKDVGELGWT